MRRATALAIAAINAGVVLAGPDISTLPFCVACAVVALVAGWRFPGRPHTRLVLAVAAVSTGLLIVEAAMVTTDQMSELVEVLIVALLVWAMLGYALDLRRALDEVHALADERAELLDQQQRLLHDVAHELRTPVTIARGHLEVLLSEAASPPAEAAIAVDELGRLGHIIDQLLRLARLESRDVRERVDLEELLADAFLRWAEVAPRGYRLGEIAAGSVEADPEALRIAVDELLSNAIGHTRDGHRVELRASGRDDTVVIEVADGGPGVSAEALERIFRRSERAGDDRRNGSGLGLAIVTGIAQAHGGTCRAESSEAGSTFSLVLPGFRAHGAT